MGQLQFNLYDAVDREFVLPDEVLNLKTTNAEVKRIRKLNIVDSFLNEFHYLHSGDTFKSLSVITRAYGLYVGGMLAGVIVYNPPGSKSTLEFLFRGEREQSSLRQGTLALSRLVAHPDAPFNATGYLISQSLKCLWEDNRERVREGKAPFRAVISFAESTFHTGTVYRVQNAWYAGLSRGSSLGGFYNPVTGHVINTRQGKMIVLKDICPIVARISYGICFSWVIRKISSTPCASWRSQLVFEDKKEVI